MMLDRKHTSTVQHRISGVSFAYFLRGRLMKTLQTTPAGNATNPPKTRPISGTF